MYGEISHANATLCFNYGGCRMKRINNIGNKGQYKIQQMAFMILAIFFFFVLVGLFFVGWQFANVKKNVAQLQEEKALSALKVIADSTELNCDQSEDYCIDRDKLIAFSEHSHLYADFWSIASIELLMVYPPRSERQLDLSGGNGENSSFPTTNAYADDEPILCPAPGCDYYVLYDSGQVNKQTFSAYVTVCEKVDRSHEICELAKLLLGVKIRDDI